MNIFSHIISTEYSNEEAFGNVKEFISIVKEMSKESGETPAIILAEKLSVASHIPFYKECIANDIKPVLGLKANILDENGFDNEFIFIAKNEEGRYQLNKIISESYKTLPEKPYKTMLLTNIINDKIYENTIAVLTNQSKIAELILSNQYEKAKEEALRYKGMFKDDFYLSIKRVAITKLEQEKEEAIIENVKKISEETGIKVIATNDVRFPKKEDYESHIQRKAILNKHTLHSPHIPVMETPRQYLIPTNSMLKLFSDYQEAVLNVGDIVESTDMSELKPKLKKPKLPLFPIPAEFNNDSEKYLKHVTHIGFEKRWEKIETELKAKIGTKDHKDILINEQYIKDLRKTYEDRIETESEVIKNSGFAGYFLIIHEVVTWCKENNIPVGHGRGSGAGSLVLFSLTVTNIDPIKHELLFERFLNPERISEPDVDIDFSPKNRHRVIQHMVDLYGRENTAQILTENKMGAKNVIENVARILGLKPSDRDKVKDFFPDDEDDAVVTTIEMELEHNPKLKESYKNSLAVRNIVDMALKLEGATTAYGKHAGGVVISRGAMHQYTGLYRGKDDQPVVQINKDLCEEIGLIKFDILGLKNLDTIQEALNNINRDKPKEQWLLADDIPIEDPKSFNLFKSADTYGIFQFESAAMRRLMAQLRPETLDEVIALVALFRPGPLQSGMSSDFVDRKHGKAPIEYPHIKLEELLAPTYGTIIYQEQVMSIARILAGFTLGQADLLRKAMGKKKPEEMAKQQAVFNAGCVDCFREEVLNTTSSKLKSVYTKNKTIPIDINLADIELPFVKDLVKESNGKIIKIDQIAAILKEIGGVGEEGVKDFVAKNSQMREMEFFKSYYPQIVSHGTNKLMKEGYELEDAEQISARLGIASSIFIRFNRIFNDMEKFAAYGFNKSHSVAYAYVSMQTAYLKAHYPSQYMSSLMSNDKNIEKLSESIIETRRMGLKILKPNINDGFEDFYPISTRKNETQIRYGLSQIKGLKTKVKGLIQEREKSGKVNNIYEFYDKYANNTVVEEEAFDDGTVKVTKTKLMGITVFNNLINSGALDCICPNEDPNYRAHLYKTYNSYQDYNNYTLKNITKKLSALNKDLKGDTEKNNALVDYLNSVVDFKISTVMDFSRKVKEIPIDKVREILNNISVMFDINIESEDFKNYLTKIEKSEFEVITNNGKELIYVVPTSSDYEKIYKPGTPECAKAEYELTGMYQSTHPMDLQKKKGIMTIPEQELVQLSDIKGYIETFGKKTQSDKVYAKVKVAGALLSCSFFNRNYEGSEAYTEVILTIDDGTGIANVKVKAEEIFNAGKEQRGIDMLKKNMVGSEVVFVSGSASLGNYESEGTNVYADIIGSGNPDYYLPVGDPELNAYDPIKNKGIVKEKTNPISGPKASENQLNFLRNLLEQNNVSYVDFLEEHDVNNFSDLSGKFVSECINKYKSNSPKSSNSGGYQKKKFK